jgi:hypothetical protein
MLDNGLGRYEEARDAALRERLAEPTRARGTDFGLGIEARSRALVSSREVAEGLYREAIDPLDRTQLRPELARAHLPYGEWRRRENRRPAACQQLRTAHEMLATTGAEALAERAGRDLWPRARRCVSAQSNGICARWR